MQFQNLNLYFQISTWLCLYFFGHRNNPANDGAAHAHVFEKDIHLTSGSDGEPQRFLGECGGANRIANEFNLYNDRRRSIMMTGIILWRKILGTRMYNE